MNKIIRVFPRRTKMTPNDDLVYIGGPTLFLPDWRDIAEVHISVTFTWHIEMAKRLLMEWCNYHPDVRIGGPDFADADGFTPGMYLKNGVTITSRGCNNQCPPCLVWRREGPLTELPIKEGNIVQDNNLLQCSRDHIDNVFNMLCKQNSITLAGGLDPALITDYIADRLRSLKINQIFLAADYDEALKPLRKAVAKLKMPRDKLRCYVLLGYKESYDRGLARLYEVWEAGCMPFAQLYQPPDEFIKYNATWRDLARQWSRPAIMKSIHKDYSTPVVTNLEGK